MSIKAKESTVRNLLTNHPELRDNTQFLIVSYWIVELHSKGINPAKYFDILELIGDGKPSRPDSITRASRRIQEVDPSLRTENWYKRHKMQVPTIEDINLIK